MKTLRQSLALTALAFCASLFACDRPSGDLTPPAGEQATQGALPRGTLTFEGGPTIWIEIATASEERRIGLSHREELCPDCGLYFVFPEKEIQVFWMRYMHFPIDIIWIDEGRVVGYLTDVQPEREDPDSPSQRFRSPVPLRHVLEVNAGFVERHGIKTGQVVRVTL